ncbi:MAG: hypothetical protein H7328_12545 [Bdellovibrio sp.]|nr:hypothetical protein [Bdellovibrio sp.]
MSQKKNFLKNTLDLIESDTEVKSYIYQQMMDFNPFVTPETLVMVIARDPNGVYTSQNPDEASENEDQNAGVSDFKFRIAVILKDKDTSIEAEAYDNDIFAAIRLAKENLLSQLIEIQNELESSQDRLRAIQQASDHKPVH